MVGKESIGPALMICATASALTAPTFAEYAAQAHAYPAVERAKGGFMAMFEVAKPASQRPIHIGDDLRKAQSVGALGEVPEPVFELTQAFLTRPTIAALEMIAQEVKAASLGGVHDMGLIRMK